MILKLFETMLRHIFFQDDRFFYVRAVALTRRGKSSYMWVEVLAQDQGGP